MGEEEKATLCAEATLLWRFVWALDVLEPELALALLDAWDDLPSEA